MQPDERTTCPECGANADEDQVDTTTFTQAMRGETSSMPGRWRCLTRGCPNGPSDLTLYLNDAPV